MAWSCTDVIETDGFFGLSEEVQPAKKRLRLVTAESHDSAAGSDRARLHMRAAACDVCSSFGQCRRAQA